MKREFPDHPLVGVGGVVIRGGRVLLIRRGREPLKGEWSIPGGMLELGEELVDGARRELREETGLAVKPLAMIAVFDRVMRENGRVKYHYVIVDYVCRVQSGKLAPASDVVDARWVARTDLPHYRLTPKAAEVIGLAFEHVESRKR
jgi:8-oxo-dGTP diphosphatase